MFKITNKDIRTTLLTSGVCIVNTNMFYTFFSVSIVGFK